jgi:hypothetical protein
MPPRPNQLHDALDALLDGRPVELTDELGPLVEAADALRAELASYELDPEVADRHLERILERPGTVLELPVRRQPSGWDVRRRVVAVALAAALVLVPATMASAAALPGQAMYPLKLAIEQLRVASVQWSPAREAAERTRIAEVRRDELEQVTGLEMFNQIEPAVNAVTNAVLAAQKAVAEASREGVAPSELADLTELLDSVEGRVDRTFVVVASALKAAPATMVSGDIRQAALEAVQESQKVLKPRGTSPSPVTTPDPKESWKPPPPSSAPGSSNPTSHDPSPPPPQPSDPPPDPTQPSTTQTTSPPDPTTTTEPEPEPTTTTEPATPESVEAGGSLGAAGESPAPAEVAPYEVGDEAPPPPGRRYPGAAPGP